MPDPTDTFAFLSSNKSSSCSGIWDPGMWKVGKNNPNLICYDRCNGFCVSKTSNPRRHDKRHGKVECMEPFRIMAWCLHTDSTGLWNSLSAFMGVMFFFCEPLRTFARTSSGFSRLTRGFFSGAFIFQTTIGDCNSNWMLIKLSNYIQNRGLMMLIEISPREPNLLCTKGEHWHYYYL